MTLIFFPGDSYAPIIFQENILSILSRELGGRFLKCLKNRRQRGQGRASRHELNQLGNEMDNTVEVLQRATSNRCDLSIRPTRTFSRHRLEYLTTLTR